MARPRLGIVTEPVDGGQPTYGPDDLLTVAVAAEIANRCVRTIRRAYRRGALIAHQDGNGRTIRIRYADLRVWMMAKPAVPEPVSVERPVGEIRHRKRAERRAGPSENLRLLNAARQRRNVQRV